jgi:hypothetical protein
LKKNLKGIGFYAGVLVVLIIILAFMYDQNETEEMSYYKMTQLFHQEQVVSFVLDGNVLAMDLKDGSKVEKCSPAGTSSSLTCTI